MYFVGYEACQVRIILVYIYVLNYCNKFHFLQIFTCLFISNLWSVSYISLIVPISV